jgi:hypothetical protein
LSDIIWHRSHGFWDIAYKGDNCLSDILPTAWSLRSDFSDLKFNICENEKNKFSKTRLKYDKTQTMHESLGEWYTLSWN